MTRLGLNKWIVHSVMVSVPTIIFLTLILQYYNNPFKSDWNLALLESFSQSAEADANAPGGPCTIKRECPDDHFSFFIQSGAANVFGPKICIQNELVLGTVLNNAVAGLNIVIVNGRTGALTKAVSFDTYGGAIEPLIEFLKNIDQGSVIMVASYDEPSTKLNEEARTLFAELGSSSIHSLGFRDNWVFIGGKGDTMKSKYEKYMKNDAATNKYEHWPELINMDGCLPKNLN
ncbi:protein FAM3C-like [Stegastes partitus]|uniref:Protein FAM3C-like n=1 Tax=Stegastes partitus TaxID=144197 RepID=A0A3B4ZB14_9TELE|nr:PREDICTED: protein FAM3C-like [Stegastes partitus]